MKYFDEGDYHKAIIEFKEILKIDPNHQPSLMRIEICNKKIAEEKIKLDLKKKHWEAGIKYFNEGEYHKAINEFKEILKIDPNHQPSLTRIDMCNKKIKEQAEEYYTIGLRHYHAGEINEAITMWEKCLQIDPEHEKARKALEKARKELGH